MWMHSLLGKGNREDFVWNHSQGEISTAVHHRTGIHTQIESKANSLHLFTRQATRTEGPTEQSKRHKGQNGRGDACASDHLHSTVSKYCHSQVSVEQITVVYSRITGAGHTRLSNSHSLCCVVVVSRLRAGSPRRHRSEVPGGLWAPDTQ